MFPSFAVIILLAGEKHTCTYLNLRLFNHFSTTALLWCDHWVRHSQRLCKKIDCVTSNQDFNGTTQFVELERNIYSERRIINKDKGSQIKSLQRFLSSIYGRSSYFIVSVCWNSVNIPITNITNAFEITPIVSWNFDLLLWVVIRSISPLLRSSAFHYDLSFKLSNKWSKT